jgi:hypothetical protein
MVLPIPIKLALIIVGELALRAKPGNEIVLVADCFGSLTAEGHRPQAQSAYL